MAFEMFSVATVLTAYHYLMLSIHFILHWTKSLNFDVIFVVVLFELSPRNAFRDISLYR